jgi:hypothetical protein
MSALTKKLPRQCGAGLRHPAGGDADARQHVADEAAARPHRALAADFLVVEERRDAGSGRRLDLGQRRDRRMA